MHKNDQTLLSKLCELADQYPEKIVIQTKQNNDYLYYTYQQFFETAKTIANTLIDSGVQKGDRIAIVLENRAEWGFIYFGILFSGAIAVPLDPQSTQDDMQYFLEDSACKIVFTSNQSISSIIEIDNLPKSLQKIICIGNPTSIKKTTIKINSFDATLKNSTQRSLKEFPDVTAKDIASILYTSGTTGKPKGVMLTQQNFYSNFTSINQLHLFKKGHNIISILPLHHSFPFMATLIIPLFSLCRITYVGTLKSEKILKSMRETGVTILVGVPQLYYIFQKNIEDKIKQLNFFARITLKILIQLLWSFRKVTIINCSKYLLPMIHQPFGKHLKYFVCGGAKLNLQTAKFLTKIGFTLIEGYGLTETSPVVTFSPLHKPKIGSVGTVIPNVKIKIVNHDDDGNGEIAIYGPNVMKGYYHNEKATHETIKDGWFYSGDLGHIDKNGYVYITGRKKELIVLSTGKNINPEEIEIAYIKSQFIKELCVAALGEKEEERLMAVIVPNFDYIRQKGDVNIYGAIKWDLENVAKQLPAYKHIMGFVISKEPLPRTRLGKLKRYLIKQQYHDELLGFESRSLEEKEIDYTEEDLRLISSKTWQIVHDIIKHDLPSKKTIHLDDHFEIDLGMDSLSRVELMVKLEKQLNIKIPEEFMAKIFTLRELLDKINQLLGQQKLGAIPEKIVKVEKVSWKDIILEDPSQEVKNKIDLNPSKIAMFNAFLICGWLYFMFKLFWQFKIFGVKNLPQNESYIICSNHNSYFDGLLITASIPKWLKKTIYLMSYRGYFEIPIFRHLISFLRIIPIDPGARLIDAMQASSYLLRNQKVVAIFPEGARSIDGEVKPFKKGIGILAKELNVRLLPVYIQGSFEAWPRGRRFPKLHPISIHYGKPIDTKILEKAGKKLGAQDNYEAIALAIREEVIKLKRD